MTESKALEILKQAMLLETRGRAFYSNVANNSSNSAVKEFFRGMAEEESRHLEVLGEQYRNYQEKGQFKDSEAPKENSGVTSFVLSEDLKQKIAAAEFEAAAISAAILMEERAIELYSQRASESQDKNEKALYGWLAAWEKEHHDCLAKIDKEVTQRIWSDSHFWPF